MAAATVKNGLWSITSGATPTEIVALLQTGVISSDNIIGFTSEGSSLFAVLYKRDREE